MSRLQRVITKMTGYVGDDAKGRPLKVGDIVEPASSRGTDSRVSCRLKIRGWIASNPDGQIGIDLEDTITGNDVWSAASKHLLKVDNDDASWEEIERSTGWRAGDKVTEKSGEVV